MNKEKRMVLMSLLVLNFLIFLLTPVIDVRCECKCKSSKWI